VPLSAPNDAALSGREGIILNRLTSAASVRPKEEAQRADFMENHRSNRSVVIRQGANAGVNGPIYTVQYVTHGVAPVVLDRSAKNGATGMGRNPPLVPKQVVTLQDREFARSARNTHRRALGTSPRTGVIVVVAARVQESTIGTSMRASVEPRLAAPGEP